MVVALAKQSMSSCKQTDQQLTGNKPNPKEAAHSSLYANVCPVT